MKTGGQPAPQATAVLRSEVKKQANNEENDKFERREIELHGLIGYHSGLDAGILANQPYFREKRHKRE